MAKRITAEEYAEKINNIFEGKLTVIKETFKGMKHNVSIKCNIHNCIFEVNAYSLSIKDTNCPLCGKELNHKKRITPWDKILKRFKTKYRDLFSYDESTYNGYKTEMKVMCNKCNSEFWITPEHHLKYNNGGCPKCHLTVIETCYICGTKFEIDRRQKGHKHLMCPKCKKQAAKLRSSIYIRMKRGLNIKDFDLTNFLNHKQNTSTHKNVLLLDGSFINTNIIYASVLYYENKISFETIKETFPKLIKVCSICKNEFVIKVTSTNTLSKANTCSNECHNILKSKRAKETYLKVKAEGRFKGWTTRKINSYAEKYWMKVLDNLNIPYIREEHFGRYFLDFKIDVGNFKLDLEIDGHQHTYRVEHDKERDAFLKENGFIVYRIPWNTVNTENGRQLMKEKIDKFLEFYNSLKE